MLPKRAKLSNHKVFNLGAYKVDCWRYDSPYSWGHYAELYEGDKRLDDTKFTYYNRTWESYTYQSILHGILGSNNLSELAKLADKVGADNVQKELGNLAGLVKAGQLLGVDGVKTLNLATGGAVEVPGDWEELPEETKEERINKVLNLLEDK